MRQAHLFVDISSHGFGHLGQTAPILNALAQRLPTLRLTIRSGLPAESLRARLQCGFTHIAAATDFGYIMSDADAIQVDLAATATAYRTQHRDWAARVAAESVFLSALHPDLVLSNVAYLPLAGAAQAGISALSLCSINWADLFAHFFAAEPWAGPIYDDMLTAYRGAGCFLRLTPGMPMPALPHVHRIGPVAALGSDCRASVRAQLGCAEDEQLVLIAFGGFTKRLPVEDWSTIANVRWLIPGDWQLTHPTVRAFEPLGRPFPDLLRAVDAVITKPGYGTFAEAACNGTPVLYVRRGDWPEQDCLIDWLRLNGRCSEISGDDLLAGRLRVALDDLRQQPVTQPPAPGGAEEAAEVLYDRLYARLTAGSRSV
jgi:hypothetical protein